MFNRPLFVCAFTLLAPSMTLAETETCQKVVDKDIAALFVRWNDALQSGDPQNVVDTYAQDSLLLPTLSNTPRRSADAKADYFRHFMAGQPRGNIDSRMIQIDCNTALDAGLYTFRFADGKKVQARYTFTYKWFPEQEQWLITSHHSSAMPEPQKTHE